MHGAWLLDILGIPNQDLYTFFERQLCQAVFCMWMAFVHDEIIIW